MPNREIRTDVVIKGRVEGLSQVTEQVEKLTKAASQAQAALVKGFNDAQNATTKFVQGVSQNTRQVGAIPTGPGRPGGLGMGMGVGMGGYPGMPGAGVGLGIGGFGGGWGPPRYPGIPIIGGGGGGWGGGGGGPKGPGNDPGDKAKIDFSDVTDGLDAIKASIDQLVKVLGGEADKEDKEDKKSKDEERREKQKEGSFLHGLLQTGLPTSAAPFLARGPGMGREAFGQMIGQSISGMGRGFGTTAVSGMAGIQEAIKNIPILPGTGVIAGLLGAAASYRGAALQREETRLGTMPWLQGEGGVARARRAQPINAPKEQAEMKESTRLLGEYVSTGEGYELLKKQMYEASLAQEYRKRNRMGQPEGLVAAGEGFINTVTGQPVLGKETKTPWGELGRKAEILLSAEYQENITKHARKMEEEDPYYAEKLKGSITEAFGEQWNAVEGKQTQIRKKYEIPAAYMGIRAAGLRYAGMAEPEALQFAAGVTQAGGGGQFGMQAAGMSSAAFAARTLYGMDEGTIGAFLKAQRRGGLAGVQVGGLGAGGEAMAQTIGDAMKLGLEGSEINDYMKTVAEGIQQFQHTGIPFPKDAFAGIADELAKGGMAGPRGSHVTQGFVQAAQALSTRGPQTAAELMMLQTMGGYSGGGAADMEQAQLALEQGQFGGKGMQTLFQRYMKAGGGGASGRMLFRHTMGGMGIQIGVRETQLMEAQMTGKLSPDQQKELDRIQTQRATVQAKGGVAGMGAPGGLDQMLVQAREAMHQFGGAVAAQAALVNKQADVGARLMEPMRKFEEATTALAAGVTNLVQKPLNVISSAFSDGGKAVEEFTNALNKSKDSMWKLKETGTN